MSLPNRMIHKENNEQERNDNEKNDVDDLGRNGPEAQRICVVGKKQSRVLFSGLRWKTTDGDFRLCREKKTVQWIIFGLRQKQQSGGLCPGFGKIGVVDYLRALENHSPVDYILRKKIRFSEGICIQKSFGQQFLRQALVRNRSGNWFGWNSHQKPFD